MRTNVSNELNLKEIEKTKSTHYETARGRKAAIVSDHEKRLASAYALLDRPAPVLNRIDEVREAAAPLVAHHSPEAAASRLAEAALDPEADLDALVAEAIAEHAASQAWDSLNLHLSRAGSKVAERRYNEARIEALRDLDALARKTLADLKRAARKLDAVEDVFDAVAIVNAEADVTAVSAIRRALATLGTIARLDLAPADGFRGLLRLVDVPETVTDYTDPAAVAVRSLTKIHPRVFDYDRTLADIARGRHESLTLGYAASDAEVSKREQKLDAILSLPAPRVNPYGNTADRQARRRNAVGPSSN